MRGSANSFRTSHHRNSKTSKTCSAQTYVKYRLGIDRNWKNKTSVRDYCETERDGERGRWRGRGSGCNDNDWNRNGERNKELKTNIVVTLSKQTSAGLNRHLSKQHDAEIVRAIDSVLSGAAFEQRVLVPAYLTTTTTEDCCGWVNPFLTLVKSYDVMAKVSHLPERRHRTSWFTSVYAWSVGRPAPFLFMHHKKKTS